MRIGNTLLEEINLTTGQKLTCHDIFTSFWGMGDGGAAPMQVEIGEDYARDEVNFC